MSYIQDKIQYGRLHKNERQVLEYLFCTLGNGIDLNLKVITMLNLLLQNQYYLYLIFIQFVHLVVVHV